MKREEYISDEMVVKRVNEAVRLELEKKKAMDVPAIIYDGKSQIIYQENSDGTRVEVGRRMRKGRYSERVAKDVERSGSGSCICRARSMQESGASGKDCRDKAAPDSRDGAGGCAETL